MFEEIMTKTAAKTEAICSISESDYIGKDGLIYCGSCHTPKQVKISLNNIQRTMPCICHCMNEKYENELRAIREENMREQIRRIRNEAFPDGICKKHI